VLRVLLFDNQPAPAWRTEAACATEAGELFHPAPNQRGLTAAAKRVCASCPVRAQCLADALGWETAATRHGILGGRTPTERARLAAQRPADGGAAA